MFNMKYSVQMRILICFTMRSVKLCREF